MDDCRLAATGIATIVAGVTATAIAVVAAERAEQKNPDQPITTAVIISAKQAGAIATATAATIVVAAAEEQ